MPEEQKPNSEEGSFKEQIMRALEENRQKRGIGKEAERSQKSAAVKVPKRPDSTSPVSPRGVVSEEAAKAALGEEQDSGAVEKEELPLFEQIGEKWADLRRLDYDEHGEKLNEESSLKRAERKKEDRVVRKIVYILTIAIVIIVGIAGISGYNYINAGLKPLDKNDNKMIQVEIPSGSSNRRIGEILEKKDVIRNGLVFNFYTKFKNFANFQAGYYQFSPNMTLEKISKELQQGGNAEPLGDAYKLTIPEGYDVDKIAALVSKKTASKKEDFLALMKDEGFFNELKASYPELLTDAGNAQEVRYRLEGYLFPATYNTHKSKELKELVKQMVGTMDQMMKPYYSKIKEKNLSVHEVMTLASLVEKEGVTQADRKKIAQVFFNRLSAKMPFQSDISILYALGEHKEKVSYKDTEVDSPYNLYTHTGYGPGPLDSPSQESVAAVLEPVANDYYYFVADISTRKVYYAKTYDEHMALVEKYVNKK